MAYVVNPKSGLIECDTAEEALALAEKIGSRMNLNSPPKRGKKSAGATVASALNGDGGHNDDGPTGDITLLAQLYAAGAAGVETERISATVKAQRKGIPGALHEWAQRMGLITEDGPSAFTRVRLGNKRGWRLTPTARATAKEVLASRH
jgi:hypothetical protein